MTWSRREVLGIGGLTLATAACKGGRAPEATAGDVMVATFEPTDTAAILWARAPDPGRAVIELGERRQEVVLEPEADNTVALDALGLEPDTAYAWRLVPARGAPSAPARFRTAPAADADVTARIAVVADISERPEYASMALSNLSLKRPALLVSLGDVPYADVPRPGARTVEEYRAKHRAVRSLDDLSELLRRVGCCAIYDDHEVFDDWDAAFREAHPQRVAAALRAWDDYFPLRGGDGRRYRAIRWGKHAELFVLDTRLYRSAHRAPDGPDKTMLGREQLSWLAQALAASDATFKLVCSSVPLAHDTTGEAWSAYGRERDELLALLRATPGAVVIAGDQHWFAAHDHDDGLREYQIGPTRANLRPMPNERAPGVLARWAKPNSGFLEVSGEELVFTAVDSHGDDLFRENLAPRAP